MNIQIFGTKKSQDTKKAERYFKERGIKFQAVDLKEKGINIPQKTTIFIETPFTTLYLSFILFISLY